MPNQTDGPSLWDTAALFGGGIKQVKHTIVNAHSICNITKKTCDQLAEKENEIEELEAALKTEKNKNKIARAELEEKEREIKALSEEIKKLGEEPPKSIEVKREPTPILEAPPNGANYQMTTELLEASISEFKRDQLHRLFCAAFNRLVEQRGAVSSMNVEEVAEAAMSSARFTQAYFDKNV